MEKYFKRKAPEQDNVNQLRSSCLPEINWEDEIKYDPGLRKEIDSYHPNQRENVRRKYLENEPCQPRTCIFPPTQIGEIENPRSFQPEWFDEFDWLEYSETKKGPIVFTVSYSEKRRMQVTKHLLLMVGMVIIGKKG